MQDGIYFEMAGNDHIIAFIDFSYEELDTLLLDKLRKEIPEAFGEAMLVDVNIAHDEKTNTMVAKLVVMVGNPDSVRAFKYIAEQTGMWKEGTENQ
jgi:hypothetical protein